MARVRVQGLTKRFDEKAVLDNVCYEVENGEFFVILGPSGCGKSTMLKIIAGLEEPDEGAVYFDDRNILSLPSRERNLGMVFQDYWLYPHMTVYENIAYGLDARGFNKGEIKRRVTEAVAFFGLEDYLEHIVTDLSGGEQQRVGLARAVVKDADAFLFDEPLSSLDAKMRNQARQYIVRMHRRAGKATIYVTHDQSEAFALADRIAVMSRGRVMQIGPPQEIYDHPQNVFVARFVGLPAMNLFRGRLSGQGGEQRLAGLDLNWHCRDEACLRRLNANRGRDTIVGIRPEAFKPVGNSFEHPDAVNITGVIKAFGELAGEVEVTLTLQSGHEFQVVIRGTAGNLAVGAQLSLAAEAASVHLFDDATENALPG